MNVVSKEHLESPVEHSIYVGFYDTKNISNGLSMIPLLSIWPGFTSSSLIDGHVGLWEVERSSGAIQTLDSRGGHACGTHNDRLDALKKCYILL